MNQNQQILKKNKIIQKYPGDDEILFDEPDHPKQLILDKSQKLFKRKTTDGKRR